MSAAIIKHCQTLLDLFNCKLKLLPADTIKRLPADTIALNGFCEAIDSAVSFLDSRQVKYPFQVLDNLKEKVLEQCRQRKPIIKLKGKMVAEADKVLHRTLKWLERKPTTKPACKFAKVLAFAERKLKGKERSVIEIICAAGGSVLLCNLAAKVQWNGDSYVNSWNACRRRLNPKLKKVGCALYRLNNNATIDVQRSTISTLS